MKEGIKLLKSMGITPPESATEQVKAESAMEIQKRERQQQEDTKRQKYFSDTIPERYRDIEVKDLIINDDNKDQIIKVKEWIDSFKKGKWLVFSGTQGTGKTLLKNLIIKELYNRHGIKTMSEKMYSIFIKYTDSLRSGNTESYLNELTKYDAVAIDEIGRKDLTQAVHDFFFEFVDRMYEKKKTLILCSNLPIKSKNDSDKTISDYIDLERLIEAGTLIPMSGDSFRGKK